MWLFDRLNDAFQVVLYYLLVFVPTLLVYGLIFFVISAFIGQFWGLIVTLILFFGRNR